MSTLSLEQWKALSLPDQADILERGLPPPEGAGLFGLSLDPDQAGLVVIPVPLEATTSYGRGTAGGPEAIRRASHQLDLEDLVFGQPYRQGVALVGVPEALRDRCARARAQADPARAGDADALREVNDLCAVVHTWVREEARRHLAAGRKVAVLGGDHSSPLGLVEALGERHPRFGLLQVDAHFDLRPAYEGFRFSHASIMHNVVQRVPQVDALVQVGIRDFSRDERLGQEALGTRGRVLYGPVLHREKARGVGWARQVEPLLEALPEQVYVSFDIDGLDPGLCPHTGTPVPGGLGFDEAAFLLEQLVASGRTLIGFDLCEVAPDPAGGEWDANVGARVLYKLCGAAGAAR